MQKYWLDFAGQLWKGPVETDSNLRYARFHGFMTCHPFDEIWILERSDWPLHSWEISETTATKLMQDASQKTLTLKESASDAGVTARMTTATSANGN